MPIAPLPQSEHAPSGIWRQFLDALREAGFEGEIDASYGTQTLFATDNSLYQYPPKACSPAMPRTCNGWPGCSGRTSIVR